MTQKPKIQYIGQFYIHGSEAQAVAQKQKQKKAKTKLPLAKISQVPEIQVEPVAMAGILVALALMVTMALGALQLRQEWQAYTRMRDYVDALQQTNVRLLADYRASYDLEEMRTRALAMGLVPKDQVKTMTITLTPPVEQTEETLWDDIVWFFQGLFA